MLSNKRTVFISGSAYEYGRFGDSGKDFIRNLSKALLQNNFKLLSGFGLGVGRHVIDATVEEVYQEKQASIQDHLQVYPFPSANHPETIKSSYRHDLIRQSQVAIFLFGNKLEDICIREANGMVEEFDIAHASHSVLIPVGASGYVAAKLWQKLMDHYDSYLPHRNHFELYRKLGDTSISNQQLIDTIIQIAA